MHEGNHQKPGVCLVLSVLAFTKLAVEVVTVQNWNLKKGIEPQLSRLNVGSKVQVD